MPNLSTRDNDIYRIDHMIAFCEKIIKFSAEDVESDSDISEMRILALLRLFETLGEAAGKVSIETRTAHPEIPWQAASDTRNRLIHGYDDLDYSILWYAAEHNIPPLLDQLNALRKELT
jgi:uncharacterized protein with HEPN domain